MPGSGNITTDTSAHDGGLARCLQDANLHADIVKAVTAKPPDGVGCEDLTSRIAYDLTRVRVIFIYFSET